MDEDEFTLPALLVTDHIIQGLQSGSVSCMLPGMHTHTETHAARPARSRHSTQTHAACSAHVSVQILASEAGATLPGVNEENQLSFLTQLCDACVEVRACAQQQLPTPAALAWHTELAWAAGPHPQTCVIVLSTFSKARRMSCCRNKEGSSFACVQLVNTTFKKHNLRTHLLHPCNMPGALCAVLQKKLDADQVLAAIAAAGLAQQDVGADLAEALW